MSSFDLTHDPKPIPLRRVEVITGVGGRRKWDGDTRADIMLEAMAPGAIVSAVARRHDLRPQQLFGWLREARRAAESPNPFVPVVLEGADVRPAAAPQPKKRRRRSREGGIELTIDGVVVRVERGAEAKTITAVIQALKAER